MRSLPAGTTAPSQPVCFGKLPTHGDFVRAGPDALVGWLDRWISAAVDGAAANPHWKPLYDRSAPLDFAVLDAASPTAVSRPPPGQRRCRRPALPLRRRPRQRNVDAAGARRTRAAGPGPRLAALPGRHAAHGGRPRCRHRARRAATRRRHGAAVGRRLRGDLRRPRGAADRRRPAAAAAPGAPDGRPASHPDRPRRAGRVPVVGPGSAAGVRTRAAASGRAAAAGADRRLVDRADGRRGRRIRARAAAVAAASRRLGRAAAARRLRRRVAGGAARELATGAGRAGLRRPRRPGLGRVARDARRGGRAARELSGTRRRVAGAGRRELARSLRQRLAMKRTHDWPTAATLAFALTAACVLGADAADAAPPPMQAMPRQPPMAGASGAAGVPGVPGVPGAPGAPGASTTRASPIVARGAVPDDATRQAIVSRLRELFGADAVDDRITIGARAAPAGWGDAVGGLLTPALRRVRDGRLNVRDRTVVVSGEVASASERDMLLASLARGGYTLHDALRLAPEQAAIDAAIAGRTVEFDPGAATLTPAGERLLAELLPLLQRLPGRGLEIVGHTDAAGAREANLALSRARAATVKGWLAANGIAAAHIATRGVGPDEPVADNAQASGRARNRRIEFRVGPLRESR
ncbi:MAG: type VI secretion system-associated protein TagF [Comamonadaceae bacterium]|nr:type VI secretion system-associated protein TagF [Comamonadaceae bacterium]